MFGRKIESTRTLLFLDEIQATPNALAALRYFYEERPELPVIVAGSLLEFTLAKHAFSMPVGRVEYHHISPVSFSEFIACTDPDLNPWREAAARFETVPESAHRRLLSRMREFFYVGGMPEAMQVFLETGSLKSLQQFFLEKRVGQAVRFDLSPSSRMMAAYRARADQTVHAVTFELLSLPLYAVEALPLAGPATGS